MNYYFPQRHGSSGPRRTPPRVHRPGPSRPRLQPGSMGARIAAYFIDVLLQGVIAIGVLIVVIIIIAADSPTTREGITMGIAKALGPLKIGITLFVPMIYALLCYLLFGSNTFGKKLFGLRVIDRSTGKDIGVLVFVLRSSLGLMCSGMLLGLGFIITFFSPQRLALHDLIFNTQVVRS